MFALVDCNTFYVSCERVFKPSLEKKPVIVLSSNDGCAIARSQEAKKLGIEMGVPLFKIKDLVQRHHVQVFSANFALYGDLSARVMTVLQDSSPAMEVYSIDEAFLNLKTIPLHELDFYAGDLRATVKQWTGIPVSIGIAPTKTLAKIANDMAKKNAAGYFTLTCPQDTARLLEIYPLAEVWGIGRQWSRKLASFNLKTAADLARADPRWVRKTFNVVLARTALELKGISCLNLEEINPSKKNMVSSRSFGKAVSSLETVSEAVSFHASALARRLREEGSKASVVCVSLSTNRFDKKVPVYRKTHLIPLQTPSQDNSVLIKAANIALSKIFKEGLAYKKAGVSVLELSHQDEHIPYLFQDMNAKDCAQRKELLRTIDHLNKRYGRQSVVFASEGVKRAWFPSSIWRSPSYTGCWKQLPTVT